MNFERTGAVYASFQPRITLTKELNTGPESGPESRPESGPESKKMLLEDKVAHILENEPLSISEISKRLGHIVI